jgi:hypothetical protein
MEQETQDGNDRQCEKRVIDVDGKNYPIDEPVVSARQVLEIAERHPVEEYIVYWLGHDNTLQDLGLDRTVHVHEHHVAKFFTFNADRSYRFELEGKREDWGAPLITEPTLLRLACVGKDYRVFLQEKDTAPRLLSRGEVVDLTKPGIERFHVEPVIVVTVVNEENGADFSLDGVRETKLRDLFTAMYVELKVARHANDRLRCEQGGGDVFGFADLTLGKYLEAGHCRCLVWLFAGGTGGASCR